MDDEIGAGSLEIDTIPGQEEEIIVDLEEDEKHVGIVKFKIYKRKYINFNIKRK